MATKLVVVDMVAETAKTIQSMLETPANRGRTAPLSDLERELQRQEVTFGTAALVHAVNHLKECGAIDLVLDKNTGTLDCISSVPVLFRVKNTDILRVSSAN